MNTLLSWISVCIIHCFISQPH